VEHGGERGPGCPPFFRIVKKRVQKEDIARAGFVISRVR
jgi:hypothetical protein